MRTHESFQTENTKMANAIKIIWGVVGRFGASVSCFSRCEASDFLGVVSYFIFLLGIFYYGALFSFRYPGILKHPLFMKRRTYDAAKGGYWGTGRLTKLNYTAVYIYVSYTHKFGTCTIMYAK